MQNSKVFSLHVSQLDARCVSVIWFVLYVLQLLVISPTQGNLDCISKSKRHPLKSDLYLFTYAYWKCMFVDFLITYICPLPITLTIECGVVIEV